MSWRDPGVLGHDRDELLLCAVTWKSQSLSLTLSVSYVLLFVCMFVFITKSVLTYSFFPPIPALSTISRPLSSSMCSITPETANVGSSYNRMWGPGIGCWFSDRSNCSHRSLTLKTFTLTSENLSLYTTLLFFTGPYTTMQPTLLTS